MENSILIEALGVTYAAMGQEVPDAALEIIARDLSCYPVEGVLASLSRCRRELRRLALADIIDRIPGGHPGMEEAWSIVKEALGNEQITLVLTWPMHKAFFAAEGLSDDPVAARMAFKEVYQRELGIARESGSNVEWTTILGFDKSDRDAKIKAAVSQGKLGAEHAHRLLAHKDEPVSFRDLVALSPPEVRRSLADLSVKAFPKQ